MKRIACLLLAVLLLISLAACTARVEEKDPAPKPDTPPTAKELWEKAEALEDAYNSMVYTMEATAESTVGEFQYDTQFSMKVEGFDLQGDNPSYRVSNKRFGTEELFTYVGGMAYAELMLGEFKQKMTPDKFSAMALSDPDRTDASDFTPENFNKFEITEENEDGYTLTFSEPSEEVVDELFEDDGEDGDYETVVTGEIRLDAEGNYQSLTLSASRTGTVSEQEVSMTVEVALKVNSFNEPVPIGVPAGSSAFAEVENLAGITAVSEGVVALSGSPTGNLYKLNSIQLATGGDSTTIQQQSVLSYLTMDPLTMSLAQDYLQDGEVYTSTVETFLDGTYTFTLDGESEVQNVTEADVRAYIDAFPLDLLDATYYSTALQAEEESGVYILTVTPDEEYSVFMMNSFAEELLSEEFAGMIAEAEDWAFSEQAVAITADPNTSEVAVAAKFAATVTLEGEPYTVTVEYMMAPLQNDGSSAA